MTPEEIHKNIEVIQGNLSAQLADIQAAVQRLHDHEVSPRLDLTPLDVSIAQLESNHLALLALVKETAGIETIPPPPPLIPVTPSSEKEPPRIDDSQGKTPLTPGREEHDSEPKHDEEKPEDPDAKTYALMAETEKPAEEHPKEFEPAPPLYVPAEHDKA